MNVNANNKDGWLTRIKKHPLMLTIASLIGVIITLATFLGALEDIGLKVKQCLFPEKLQQQIIPVNDEFRTDEDNSILINVLENDLNVDDWEDVEVTVDRVNTKGTIDKEYSRLLRYTPPKDFSGQDEFSYLVITKNGKSEEATVHMEVAPVNDAPVTNLKEIVMSYPRNLYKVVDLVGAAHDPEKESMRLVSFNVTDTNTQPRTVFEVVSKGALIVGSYEPKQMERAKGAIVLYIKDWVKEVTAKSHEKSFSRIVNYRLEDSSGNAADFSLNVNIEVASINSIHFECQPSKIELPDKLNLQLNLKGKTIKDISISKNNVASWLLVDFDREVMFTELEKNAEMVTTWPKLNYWVGLNCNGTMWLNTSENLKWLSVLIEGSPKQNTAIDTIRMHLPLKDEISKEIKEFMNYR